MLAFLILKLILFFSKLNSWSPTSVALLKYLRATFDKIEKTVVKYHGMRNIVS